VELLINYGANFNLSSMVNLIKNNLIIGIGCSSIKDTKRPHLLKKAETIVTINDY